MSRLGTQSGLVADQALSLPAAGVTPQQRAAFLTFIDTARAQGEVQGQSGGLVGQQGERTTQLLDRAATPVSATPSPAPAGPASVLNPAALDQFAEQILARQNVVGPLERFARGGGAGLVETPQGAFDIIRAIGREREARSDPGDVIRLFDLQQRLRNEMVRAQELELSRGRFMLSEARERRFRDQAVSNVRQDRVEDFADDFRALGVSRKQLGQFSRDFSDASTFALPRGEAVRRSLSSLTSKGDLREDQRTLFERFADAGLQDSRLVEDTKIRLSAPPKKTAANIRDEKRRQDRKQLKAFIEAGRGQEALEFVVQEGLGFAAEAMLIFEQTGKTELMNQLQQLNLGLRGTGSAPSTGRPETLAEARARQAKAQ